MYTAKNNEVITNGYSNDYYTVCDYVNSTVLST